MRFNSAWMVLPASPANQTKCCGSPTKQFFPVRDPLTLLKHIQVKHSGKNALYPTKAAKLNEGPLIDRKPAPGGLGQHNFQTLLTADRSASLENPQHFGHAQQAPEHGKRQRLSNCRDIGPSMVTTAPPRLLRDGIFVTSLTAPRWRGFEVGTETRPAMMPDVLPSNGSGPITGSGIALVRPSPSLVKQKTHDHWPIPEEILRKARRSQGFHRPVPADQQSRAGLAIALRSCADV
jgi:hypothetical protein